MRKAERQPEDQRPVPNGALEQFRAQRSRTVEYYEELMDRVQRGEVKPRAAAARIAVSLNRAEHELQEAQKQAAAYQDRLGYDKLTPAFLTKPAFEKAVEIEIERMKRLNIPGTLMGIRVNGFESFPADTHTERQLLQLSADAIDSVTRKVDIQGRDGNEFRLLLNGTDPSGAQAVADRMFEVIPGRIHEDTPHTEWQPTVTIGISPVVPGTTVNTNENYIQIALLRGRRVKEDRKVGIFTPKNLP